MDSITAGDCYSMETSTCVGYGVEDHNEVCMSVVGIHLRGASRYEDELHDAGFTG